MTCQPTARPDVTVKSCSDRGREDCIMLSKTIAMIAAGACLVLAACGGLAVRTDLNPSYSVLNCHTYSFANEHVANADQHAAYATPFNPNILPAATPWVRARSSTTTTRASVAAGAMGGVAAADSMAAGVGTAPWCRMKPELRWMCSTQSRAPPCGMPRSA